MAMSPGHRVEEVVVARAAITGHTVYRPQTGLGGWKDMHTLEQDAQEVVQRYNEGVGPLPREVDSKGGVGVRGGQEGQDKPILPFSLVLELRGLLCKELLCFVISVCLSRHGRQGGRGDGDRSPQVRFFRSTQQRESLCIPAC